MTGAFGTVTKAGAGNLRMSKQNQRRGPSNKNIGPSRVSRPNPASSIRSSAGRAIKGPDKGAGGQ